MGYFQEIKEAYLDLRDSYDEVKERSKDVKQAAREALKTSQDIQRRVAEFQYSIQPNLDKIQAITEKYTEKYQTLPDKAKPPSQQKEEPKRRHGIHQRK